MVEIVASGTFTGIGDHLSSGSVTLAKAGGRAFVSLEADFAFDGAPDPKVALGKGGVDVATLADSASTATAACSPIYSRKEPTPLSTTKSGSTASNTRRISRRRS